MLKILCFGDSITLGENDSIQGGWADCLKKYYFQQFTDSQTQAVSLYNLGVAGETTDGLRLRFDTELNARNIKGQRLIVVLAHGANDIVIHKHKNRVPELYYIRNLKCCIEAAQKLKADVLLLNLLPISRSIEGQINQHGQLRFARDIQTYNTALKALSQTMQCDYLDLYTAFTDNNTDAYHCSDGVHPNTKGHELLYQMIRKKLIMMDTA